MKKKVIIFLYVTLVLLIISIPFILSGLQSFFNFKFDTKLGGYTDTAKKPETFVFKDFLGGEYQEAYKEWYEQNMPLRGFFVKNYNSLRYIFFKLANGGKHVIYNGFLHGIEHFNTKFCLEKKQDYSIKKNKLKLQEYVNDLVLLQEKLNKLGKYLYVYITPSKITLFPKTIPQKFYDVKSYSCINATESLRDLLKDTNINYWFSMDYASDTTFDFKDNLKYPTYYKTGAHWSRTFEQLASNKIIQDLSKITGKNYRKIKLGKVRESDTCIWRDCDVYDLVNIWNKIPSKYYEYNVKRELPNNFDRMRFFIYGDSYSEGFLKDVISTYPEEQLSRLDRDIRFVSYDNKRVILKGDFDKVDFKNYIDNVDVVIFEMNEPEISKYSFNFVKYLLKLLDDESTNNNNKIINNNVLGSDVKKTEIVSGLNFSNSFGLHSKEKTGYWTKNFAVIDIKDKNIKKNGLELDFLIPLEIFKNHKRDIITLYVNRKKVLQNEYNKPGEYSIVIPAKEIEYQDGDTYEVTLELSRVFVPANYSKTSKDTRKLGVYLKYLGAKR